jgi:hypothetical protein
MSLLAKHTAQAKAPVATRRSAARVVVCKATKANTEAEMVRCQAEWASWGAGGRRW